MNRNTGLLGTIVVGLLAIFGFSVRPAANKSSPEAGPAQSSAAQNSAEIVEPSQQNLQAACREINNRIAEFIPTGVTPPKSCNEGTANSALRGTEFMWVPDVRYIIATLPDPVHTHFPMLFDRLTEALQQAAQDQGYNYDGSWLPWTEEGSTGEQKADALRNRQPGVLVFRGAIPPSSDWPKCLEHPDKLCVPAPYDRGLIVFVVGENPTGGIHLSQFKNAVDWVKALSHGNWGEVRILGPYFSGSFPSLAQALLANRLIKGSEPPIKPPDTAQSSPGNPGDQGSKEPAGKVKNAKAASSVSVTAPAGPGGETKAGQYPKSLVVFSGSVSSKTGIDWFTKFLENSPAQFYSFQENDDVMIDRYCQYLTGQGYDTGKLAIISENETAYGVFPPTVPAGSVELARQSGTAVSAQWLPHCDLPAERKSAAHGPLYLYYPRDIAALRSAYEQQPSGGGSSSPGTDMGLPLDLADPGSRQRDTIRSFGGKQTPLSQEATLFGIVNLFRSHNIQFIVLRSSNSLDQVFLTRFLTRAYPQARVILTSADLLFRRSSETAGFRGTLTLTTYPLLTWQQDWTYWHWPESRHSHRAFPEDFAEGLYLATRFLIDDVDRSAGKPKYPLSLQNSSVVIQDYAPPYWLLPDTAPPHTGTRPPTWVSVIGNEQLWPVAVLDDSTIDRHKGNENNTRTLCGAGEPVGSSTLPCVATGATHHRAELPLPLATFVLGAIILVWCCWHFFCCVFGSHDSLIRLGWLSVSIPSSRSLAYFAPVSRPQHKVLIFIGCTVMGLMAILIASLTGVFSGSLPPLVHPWRDIFYCAGIFLLSWAALVSNYRTLLPGWWKKSSSPVGGGSSDKGLNKRLAERLRRIKDKIKNNLNARPIRKMPGEMRSKLKYRRLDYFSMTVGFVLFLAGGLLLVAVVHHWVDAPLSRASAVFAFWRSLNQFTGVSPLVPLLLLNAGLYGWFWYSLSGLALFNAGRFKLPPRMLLHERPLLNREEWGRTIERAAIPLNLHYGLCFLSVLVPYTLFWWLLSGPASEIHSLGPVPFGRLYFGWLGLLVVLMLTEAWLMLQTWGRLRHLLLELDRLPLRQTLLALKALSWGTVWKMSGNVIDHRLFSKERLKESLQHLEHETARFPEKRPRAARDFGPQADERFYRTDVAPVGEQLKALDESMTKSDDWCAMHFSQRPKDQPARFHPADLAPLRNFQEELATTAGVVFVGILKPGWELLGRSPVGNLPGSADDASHDKPVAEPLERLVRAGEELFCLLYVGFIQNVLGRIRTMTFSIMILFIAATLSVACYPFDPRPLLGAIFLALFVVIAAIMVFVFAQAHRDPTLSYITNTDPGKLDAGFWMKLLTFGIGPLVGLLTALFPEFTNYLTAWLQPGVQAIK